MIESAVLTFYLYLRFHSENLDSYLLSASFSFSLFLSLSLLIAIALLLLQPLPEKAKFCAEHTCKFASGCREGKVDGEDFCPTHTRGKQPSSPTKALPPPWERSKDWRKYEGPDLGGRCKIRVFYSSTTSSQEIRKNTKALMDLLERENVHKRPDFEVIYLSSYIRICFRLP